ncbi:DUF3427 domain-containing protein [Streptomyces sp. NPDC048172]|uniref:DUF3427 domain-containing protein n=1 Tax=Streptomyces sp. NPDC048172 TaxID=3365505 RepID=UPI0037210686
MFEPPQEPSQQHLATGLYEQLITSTLHERINELRDAGWDADDVEVDESAAPRILARHLASAIEQHLGTLTPLEQVLQSNLILNRLAKEGVSPHRIVEGPRQLLGLVDKGEASEIPRPSTPVSDATLITNRQEAINMADELSQEIRSADRIDLLCSFIMWSGTNTIREALYDAAERGTPIRILTTTYMGTTEPKAINRLVRDFGAEIRINYETKRSRVHAKAWLFHRKTGFHTAYVGSSNISASALSTGLEWNVRVSPISAPYVLDKFERAFKDEWASGDFEPYDPDQDYERLEATINKYKSATRRTPQQSDLTKIEPKPHQRKMLESLAAERDVYGKRGALLVAPTGTGKTVIAALDFRALRKQHGEKLRLLFVAHTREILEQAQKTYRNILQLPRFGELHVGGEKAHTRTHVFASIQSFKNQKFLESFAKDDFDIIVIDEFHHAAAKTYRKLIKHFTPKQLLGLTATPERHDGENVHDTHFGGRIAAEMRLWQAMDSNLLSPFHYYGIADDSADFTRVSWTGGYDPKELTDVLTRDEEHVNLVLKELNNKVADPKSIKALGFCVSINHAIHMAEHFQAQGIEAKALSGETPPGERNAALNALRAGHIQVLFSVNLFNEGLDIPDVDTLLFLRPTESVTVYLQQFGRGLRRTADKDRLIVLDFVGHHRSEYSFEDRLHAITGLRRNRLVQGIEDDSYGLPDGTEIILDRKSKDLIIKNIEARLNLRFPQIVKEVQECKTSTIEVFLDKSMREITDIYRGRKNSWTKALRAAHILPSAIPAGEEAFTVRMSQLLHVDDPDRIEAYVRVLSTDEPDYDAMSPSDQLYARMLILNLWDSGGGFQSYQEALDALAKLPDARSEARQILNYVRKKIEHPSIPLTAPHAHVPLRVHSTYTRAEILTALGLTSLTVRTPSRTQAGAEWCEEVQVDALFVTLVKKEKDFNENVRYNDYAMNARHFHWESPGKTSDTSDMGRRYVEHKARGTHVFPFVRKYKENETGTSPYIFLGPADYKSHVSNRPMQIIWRLQHEAPAEILTYSPGQV